MRETDKAGSPNSLAALRGENEGSSSSSKNNWKKSSGAQGLEVRPLDSWVVWVTMGMLLNVSGPCFPPL